MASWWNHVSGPLLTLSKDWLFWTIHNSLDKLFSSSVKLWDSPCNWSLFRPGHWHVCGGDSIFWPVKIFLSRWFLLGLLFLWSRGLRNLRKKMGGRVIIFSRIKEFTDIMHTLKPSLCYSQRIIKSMEKKGQYFLRSLPYCAVSIVSHSRTGWVFGFEIEGVVLQ